MVRFLARRLLRRFVLVTLLKQNPDWLVSDTWPAVNQSEVKATAAPSKPRPLWKLVAERGGGA